MTNNKVFKGKRYNYARQYFVTLHTIVEIEVLASNKIFISCAIVTFHVYYFNGSYCMSGTMKYPYG